MDGRSFDGITRSLVTGSSRRRTLKVLAGGALGAVGLARLAGGAEAAECRSCRNGDGTVRECNPGHPCPKGCRCHTHSPDGGNGANGVCRRTYWTRKACIRDGTVRR